MGITEPKQAHITNALPDDLRLDCDPSSRFSWRSQHLRDALRSRYARRRAGVAGEAGGGARGGAGATSGARAERRHQGVGGGEGKEAVPRRGGVAQCTGRRLIRAGDKVGHDIRRARGGGVEGAAMTDHRGLSRQDQQFLWRWHMTGNGSAPVRDDSAASARELIAQLRQEIERHNYDTTSSMIVDQRADRHRAGAGQLGRASSMTTRLRQVGNVAEGSPQWCTSSPCCRWIMPSAGGSAF